MGAKARPYNGKFRPENPRIYHKMGFRFSTLDLTMENLSKNSPLKFDMEDRAPRKPNLGPQIGHEASKFSAPNREFKSCEMANDGKWQKKNGV